MSDSQEIVDLKILHMEQRQADYEGVTQKLEQSLTRHIEIYTKNGESNRLLASAVSSMQETVLGMATYNERRDSKIDTMYKQYETEEISKELDTKRGDNFIRKGKMASAWLAILAAGGVTLSFFVDW